MRLRSVIINVGVVVIRQKYIPQCTFIDTVAVAAVVVDVVMLCIDKCGGPLSLCFRVVTNIK